MTGKGKHAPIFEASGISGWSLMKQCLSYPSPSTFYRVTGLCNRHIEKKTLMLPNDTRLNIVSGIDLTGSVEIVMEQLKTKVEDIMLVDIVFFCAYIQASDYASLRKINTDLLRTAIQATSAVAPNLEVVILQTGGKGYGLEFQDKIRGSKWTFSEIRPDGIVGFPPSSNAMNMAHGIAFYLTLYREVHGARASDILSQLEIYVALHREKCVNGSSFNAADGQTVSWAQIWPGLCAYFGLVGCEPQNGSQTSMEDFVNGHMDQWKRLAEVHGLKSDTVENQNWGHTHFMLVDFDFNREYSLEKARSIGFTESTDTVEGYKIVFDRMVTAKLIPAFR
ncbi:uncharacterized protein P174DRAFT_516131 [Aspergillus novofumigatus IBT 16806]|uniref:PRISE-like Rossmann-fold domain-containing protein n=1 Tax=Aspergillus novofumigatus (strain IBT 16806) TaxID=1392255 RepID=A0A2I1BU08_ASPN1|nr:uncharacterized protein P174DRAFT_516131 [Aspergillus novofumigatus IBT 16806]PKX88888.1 hypothetical protein P174DRAFT_516131 [Aspergillus novofumigatus IBT 16806]